MSRSVVDVLFEMVDLGDQLRPTEAVIGGISVRVHSIPGATLDVGLVFSVNLDVLRGFLIAWPNADAPSLDLFRSAGVVTSVLSMKQHFCTRQTIGFGSVPLKTAKFGSFRRMICPC